MMVIYDMKNTHDPFFLSFKTKHGNSRVRNVPMAYFYPQVLCFFAVVAGQFRNPLKRSETRVKLETKLGINGNLFRIQVIWKEGTMRGYTMHCKSV